ncbi:hypothetical protein [Peteryoungia ipomoeae]|uniref:Uncharacterized protein n=1 Tax=Peteryoungia ipomoeae TaxID=1210932 RepID=A0A4S8NXM4_9HYPH|nr:hypothetical protein [Peteryoungia ipomoeae]THV22443.1 hypothetical protein FAA97_14285 [Peteryoungia ipomoeae]
MLSEKSGQSIAADDLVARMISRIDERIASRMAKQQKRNATAFLTYLLENGLTDEDELFELTLLASGKLYDPQDGSFS